MKIYIRRLYFSRDSQGHGFPAPEGCVWIRYTVVVTGKVRGRLCIRTEERWVWLKLQKGGTDESSNVLKGLYAINLYFNNYIYKYVGGFCGSLGEKWFWLGLMKDDGNDLLDYTNILEDRIYCFLYSGLVSIPTTFRLSNIFAIFLAICFLINHSSCGFKRKKLLLILCCRFNKFWRERI